MPYAKLVKALRLAKHIDAIEDGLEKFAKRYAAGKYEAAEDALESVRDNARELIEKLQTYRDDLEQVIRDEMDRLAIPASLGDLFVDQAIEGLEQALEEWAALLGPGATPDVVLDAYLAIYNYETCAAVWEPVAQYSLAPDAESGAVVGVFVLEIDLPTLHRRLDERPDDEWGGGVPTERELIVRWHQTREDVPENGIVIDATASIERVVDEILRRCHASA